MEDLIVDQSRLQQQIDDVDAATQRTEARAAADQQEAETQSAIDKASETEDKGSVMGEVGNAIVGGLATGLEDITTLPARVIDMASGEMQKQGEDYKPFGSFLEEDAFETKTWWGGALKNLVNVGSLFIPVGGIAKGLGMGAKVAGAAAKGSKVAKVINNPIAKGAIKGAAVDLTLQSSQEANASAALRDHFGFIDTPLATKDTDHPAVKTLKNVVEGMGIGAAIDGVFYMFKGAAATADVDVRNQNIKDQTQEMGRKAPPDSEFDPYRDKAVANRTQGNPQSQGSPAKITEQLDRIDKNMDGEYGSTDSLLTVREVDRMATGSGEPTKVIRKLVEKYMKEDPKIAKEMADVKTGRKKLSQVKSDAVKRFQEIVGGRDLESVDVDELIANAPKDSIDGVDIVSPESVMVYDQLIGSLAKQVRDLGIAAREVKNYTDITEPGGVAESLKGKMTSLMIATKRARYMSGLNLKRYDVGGKPKPKEIKEGLKSIEDDTRAAIEDLFSMFADDPNGEMFEGFLEAMSMSNNVRSLSDFDKFMRARLKGGDFGNKQYSGLMMKELGGVMTHSILSGPKTPVRAALGTSIAGTTRMISQSLGALLRLPFTGDTATLRSSAASMGAMVGSIPEAFKVFKTKLNSYWTGELATASSRFKEFDPRDESWKALGEWAYSRGTKADQAAYNIFNISRQINDNSFMSYSTKLMAATDDAWRVIMARTRAKEKAVRTVLENKKNGVVLSAKDAKRAEDAFYASLLDDAGDIDVDSDTYLKSMVKEATLTEDLSGFSAGLEAAFNKSPYLKPFFLFARTGVNGLALTAKNTPGINLLLKKQRKIMLGNAENLAELKQYGINNMEELANEKALMIGRQAIGTGVVFMATQAWLNGDLRGNGPINRQQRRVWTDAGWRRSEFRVGGPDGVWVNFDSLEPWSQALNAIADIGDASQIMGEEWTENKLKVVSSILMEAATSKSYLQGLQQLVDLFSGEPYQAQRILGNLANNTVPMAGLRNEIGKLINPQMRELSSSIGDAVRNRNLLTESMTDKPLPVRYDILNGEPIRDWDAPTRLWNAFSPVNINFDDSPGRQLLFNSNYDMRLSTMSAPNGALNLRELPEIRSKFQKAIGDQNLEKQLNRLAMRQDIKASVAQMQRDINSGNPPEELTKYPHNRVIRQLFQTARRKAWAEVSREPEIQELMAEQKAKKAKSQRQYDATRGIEPIINMPVK